MVQYTLSSIAMVAAAVPMPDRFAHEWEDVVLSLVFMERTRVTLAGVHGVYRLCGSRKQFKTLYDQAVGNHGVGVTELFRMLREIWSTCDVAASLAANSAGHYIGVSSNYSFEWVPGGESAIPRAARFASSFGCVPFEAALQFNLDRGVGVIDRRTALADIAGNTIHPYWLRDVKSRADELDPEWRRVKPFGEGLCYRKAAMSPASESHGAWPLATQLQGDYNAFALARRVSGDKWHVLSATDTLVAGDLPLALLPDGARVGGDAALGKLCEISLGGALGALNGGDVSGYSKVSLGGIVTKLAATAYDAVAPHLSSKGFVRVDALLGSAVEPSPTTLVTVRNDAGVCVLTLVSEGFYTADGYWEHIVSHPQFAGAEYAVVVSCHQGWVVNGVALGGKYAVVLSDDHGTCIRVDTYTQRMVYHVVMSLDCPEDLQLAAGLFYDKVAPKAVRAKL